MESDDTPAKTPSASRTDAKPRKKAKFREYHRPRGGWPEIVGTTHARVCAPESIRFPPGEKSEGVLQLVVSPAHAPLIQHVIPEIMERVNTFFGYRAVARVKMRQGTVKPPEDMAKTKAPPSLKPIPMELGESLRDIGDPELRTVLESLARSFGD